MQTDEKQYLMNVSFISANNFQYLHNMKTELSVVGFSKTTYRSVSAGHGTVKESLFRNAHFWQNTAKS